MRSAILLVWISLGWTLLCFLLYRDRDVILQASAPVWIAAAAGWIVCKAAVALARRRRGGGKPRPRKRAATETAAPAGGGRRNTRSVAAKPRRPAS